MTNEDKTTTGSSKPDSAEQVQSPPPEDDAILRNLEALIGNDLQNKGNFKAAPPLAESDHELQVADNEEINTSAQQPEVRDVHHAAQLRRSTDYRTIPQVNITQKMRLRSSLMRKRTPQRILPLP